MNQGDSGAAERLLALIGEHRDSIREAMDDEQHRLLLTRLTALAGTPPDDDRAVRKALQGVRLALLPLALDHPVREEMDSSRLVAAPPGPSAVAGARELVTWLAHPSAAPEPTPGSTPELTPEPTPEPALGSTPEPTPEPAPEPTPEPAPEPATETDTGQDELLRAPALSAAEARARCGGAPPAELIRLADPRDGDRYPEFQFGAAGGSPYDVVLEVNRLLLADIDPWGAAAWWLSGNTWLGGTPARLLGRLPDHRLVGAATALVEGEG
ncbi:MULTISPECIES: hypothetical protein [unclassified Streptomyces]|uniref:hypothetical protein n=1 Tax=unclassified Streptomyces TaxID=2593676 RepID=UPI000939B1B9|nr:hypothetical protein [Streptomyces sp. TSRI0107]OKJ88669.1 hypothetical protein AMK31_09425 [Streptomyces sp. TSRI0107]